MPTADELLSQERPFFRTADYVNDPDLEPTLKAVHVSGGSHPKLVKSIEC
jgi:hypothetical protein